jgi:hypothetical protein
MEMGLLKELDVEFLILISKYLGYGDMPLPMVDPIMVDLL